MSNNPNRNVRVQSLGDAWRNHARMVPQGITPMGTVLRAGRVHAFGRDPSGEYWIFGDGRPELLPQAKIQRAIASIQTRAIQPLDVENQGPDVGSDGPDGA